VEVASADEGVGGRLRGRRDDHSAGCRSFDSVLVSGDVFDRVRRGRGCVDLNLIRSRGLPIHDYIDTEIEIGLRAGDRCTEVGVGCADVDGGGVIAVDLDDGGVSVAALSPAPPASSASPAPAEVTDSGLAEVDEEVGKEVTDSGLFEVAVALRMAASWDLVMQTGERSLGRRRCTVRWLR